MLAEVENKSDTVTTTAVNEVVQSANSPIGLVGIAGDDQGVADVQINGEVDTSCVAGNIGQLISATYLADNPDSSQPGQQACTLRTTGLNVVPSSIGCNSSFSWMGTSGDFTTSGSNFSSVVVSTATYSFTVVTPAAMKASIKPKDLRALPKQKSCAPPSLKHVKGLKKITCTEVELPPVAGR